MPSDHLRAFVLERAHLDEANQTVEASLSSETPVEQHYGRELVIEVLDHSDGAVDMSRAETGLPLLAGHDHETQIGVAENVRLEGRRLRATLRFGTGPLAQEYARDIIAGVRRWLSVGYRVLEHGVIGERDGLPLVKVSRWLPFEVSSVPVAADATIGVGRSWKGASVANESKPKRDTDQVPEEDQRPTLVRVQERAAERERDRIEQIRAIGRHWKLDDDADLAIAEGHSLERFREVVMSRMSERTAPPTLPSPTMRPGTRQGGEDGHWRSSRNTTTPEDAPAYTRDAAFLGMSKRELNEYSLLKGVRAMVTGTWQGAGLELEVSRALAQRTGKQASGLLVPLDVLLQQRDVDAATSTGWVTTKSSPQNFIDVLRNASVVMPRARVITGMARGDLSLPKKTTATTGYWIDPDDLTSTITESTPVVEALNLQLRTVGAMVDLTRKIVMQAEPAADQIVRDDAAATLALALDQAALVGAAGGNNPVGVEATAGIGAADLVTPTFANMVDLETAVTIDNALIDSAAYVTDALVIGYLKQTLKDAGVSGHILEDGMCNGYPVLTTNAISNPGARRIFFGVWGEIVIAMFGTLEIRVDETTHIAAGGLRIAAYLDADVGLRHVQAFSLNNTITTPA